MHRCITILLLAFSTSIWAQEVTPPPAVDPPIRAKNRATRDYALIIGNESYTALPHAAHAHADAASFRDYFRRTRGMSRYRSRQVNDRTAGLIRRELRRALVRVRRGGTIWLVFAGHGAATPGGLDHAILGRNATIDDVVDGATDGGVPLTEVADTLLRSTKAERIILVIDAAFGGAGRDGMPLLEGQPPPTPTLNVPDSERVTLWTAATGLSSAGSYRPVSHGLFTYLALGALRGWADGEITGQRDGKVTLGEAQMYVAWMAHQLGRPSRPSKERRTEIQAWVLAQGDHLEDRPTDAITRTLGEQDRVQRLTDAASRIRAEAAAFWPDTLDLAQAGGPGGREALEDFISAYEFSTIQIELAVPVPEVKEAQRRLAQWGMAAPAVADMAPTDLRCSDLIPLEDVAMVGRLTDESQTCLENRLTTDRLQTTKDEVSRVLIVNAQSAGDQDAWERLVRRHLEDIGRSDPDMCMRYAVFLFKRGEAYEDVIRWADVALENKHTWSGRTYVSRVNELLHLRAEAAYKIWVNATAELAREPDAEQEEVSREYRGWAMDSAREWLDYVQAGGLPSDRAVKLCMSAAGHRGFCGQR